MSSRRRETCAVLTGPCTERKSVESVRGCGCRDASTRPCLGEPVVGPWERGLEEGGSDCQHASRHMVWLQMTADVPTAAHRDTPASLVASLS